MDTKMDAVNRLDAIERVAERLQLALSDWRGAVTHFERVRAISCAEDAAREAARLLNEEMERI